MITGKVDVALLLADPGGAPAAGPSRLVMDGGRISAVTPLEAAPAGRRRLALPALSNAHDHARTFRSATLGAFGQPLESWLPYLGVVPGVDPYVCAATAFARSVRRGVAQAMVHYTRLQGGRPYVEEVQAVARAARDVGLRIGLAVAMRDRHGIALCDDATVLAALRPGVRDEVSRRLAVKPLPSAVHLALLDEVAAMLDAEPTLKAHVTLQYGPNGVQWCSTALLEAIAQASADSGRPVHMHLLETKYQREWADHAFPEGIVPYLDGLGLLSPRLTLAHCTWARPDELALLAERGVTIAINTSSNLGIKSGIAPVPEMLRQGCRLAMGLDGLAFDEDDDALREMRLAYALHRGWGFDEDMSRSMLWRFASMHGRRSVSAEPEGPAAGGRIAAGSPADLIVLDWDSLDDDTLFPDIDPLEMLLARAHGGHVDEVFIGGRSVVKGGVLQTVDEPALKAELLAQTRSALAAQPEFAQWRRTLGEMAEDLGPFYRRSAFNGCC